VPNAKRSDSLLRRVCTIVPFAAPAAPIPRTADMRRSLSPTFKAAVLLGVSLLASGAALARDWNTIRIGVDPTYKPFTFKTPDGQLTGFDVDIARALCAELKAKCSFVESSWEGIIPGLRANKFDAIISSMSITAERKKAVDFTDKYYETPSLMIAKVGGGIDGSLPSVNGKRVGVAKATVQETYAKGELGKAGAEIVSFDSSQQLYLDLKSGRVDAAVVDKFDGKGGFLDTPEGKGFAFVGPELKDPRYFGTGAGIALRKDDTELRDRFNGALKTIRANGIWKQVADKYFDFDIYGK
jgi:arginine/ornithine transport system substrate-binding protein